MNRVNILREMKTQQVSQHWAYLELPETVLQNVWTHNLSFKMQKGKNKATGNL